MNSYETPFYNSSATAFAKPSTFPIAYDPLNFHPKAPSATELSMLSPTTKIDNELLQQSEKIGFNMQFGDEVLANKFAPELAPNQFQFQQIQRPVVAQQSFGQKPIIYSAQFYPHFNTYSPYQCDDFAPKNCSVLAQRPILKCSNLNARNQSQLYSHNNSKFQFKSSIFGKSLSKAGKIPTSQSNAAKGIFPEQSYNEMNNFDCNEEIYSRKVFVGGLPPDIDEGRNL